MDGTNSSISSVKGGVYKLQTDTTADTEHVQVRRGGGTRAVLDGNQLHYI